MLLAEKTYNVIGLHRREGANSFEDDGDDDDLEDCYGDRVVDMRMKRREQNYRRSKKNNSLETLRITSDGRGENEYFY